MIHGPLLARGPAVWYPFPSGLWVSYQWFNMQKNRIIETTVVAWRSIGQFEMIRFLYCEQLSLWINTEWMTSLRKRKQSIVLECALLYRCRKTLDGLDVPRKKKQKKKRAGLPQKGHKHRLHQSRPVQSLAGHPLPWSGCFRLRVISFSSTFAVILLQKSALQPEFHSDLADCVLRATDWQPIVQQPGWCLGAFIFPLNTSLLQVVKRQPLDQCTRGTIYSSWSKCA